MKLRYKKAILLGLLSTLGMGMLTLSIDPERNAVESTNMTQDKASNITTNTNTTPTISAAPSPMPVYSLEDDGYEDITDLIKKYYKAKLTCDADTIQTLLTDEKQVDSKEQLKKNVMFIQDYKNFKCYVKKSYRKNEFLVYVSHTIKFYNIKTEAPALDLFYIIKNADGSLHIFAGEFDDATYEYYQARKQDEDVLALAGEIQNKLKEAKEKDKKFKAFLDGYSNSEASEKS